MRGIVTLAAALALPLTTNSGRPFPGREHIIFLSFAVILATLVLQGLTLGPLIRWLGIGADAQLVREEAAARLEAAHAALAAIARYSSEMTVDDATVQWMRADYERRITGVHRTFRQFGAAHEMVAMDQSRGLRLAAVKAERERIIELRNHGLIGDEVLRRIERELDLEELELG